MDYTHHCPNCSSINYKRHMQYKTKHGACKTLYCCVDCGKLFSETTNTLAFGLRTPISKIIEILKLRTEGMSVNATCRATSISKNTLLAWEKRFEPLQEALLVYSLFNQYIKLTIEGDEVYTRVNKNVPPDESKGWTIVLMDRATRFLWELRCGAKTRNMFRRALKKLKILLETTGDITLITDGESRYSDVLFEICNEVIRKPKRGRPRRTLKKGIKVRRKNKGSQYKKTGRKRPKYESPCPEHPETIQIINKEDIHANHCEAFNSSLRRRNSAFRRKTNTYAKNDNALQRTLNLYWVIHNFVRPHFTTKKVPAVALGIFAKPLLWEDLFTIPVVT